MLEQDSPLEVAQSVAVLIDTRPGERRSEPDYGVPDMLGSGIDADAIAAAIAEHEPRADSALVEQLAFGVEEHAVVHPGQGTSSTAAADLIEEDL